ncbi:hypothetical protein A0J61_03499 [Choanephora cucurbitarum]|uniref:F-box domain-containing protein n=1 Tax=Choanephora cucurbitarum TaxID=101091 RepID=A0A1C7NH46_9FUNG|nr:hypothetical protein A0J61_03499 [Choanephora cucurbitarum]
MVCTLPLEIYNAIAVHLSCKEYIQLVQVNRVFHQTFVKFLFKSVAINNNIQLKELVNDSKYHPFVWHLKVETDTLRDSDIDRIQGSLSHLRSIHLDMSFCHARSFQSFQHLSSLSLDSMPFAMHHISQLSVPPNLESLVMKFKARFTLDTDALEYIHAMCPVLKSLVIEGIHDISLRHEKLQQTAPANTMQRLMIKASHSSYQTCTCLTYIGNKYPNIVSLKLEHNFQPHLEPSNEQYPAEFCDWFLSSCPQLAYLELKDSMLYLPLFRKLRERQDTCLSIIYQDVYMSDDFLGACELNPTDFYAVKKLDICLMFFSEDSLELIGNACINLSQLTLRGSEMDRRDSFKISMVLDYFPNLKKLDMVWLELLTDKHMPMTARHPLEEISIANCCLIDGFFHSVSNCCLYLKRLSICKAGFQYQRDEVCIDLQQQELDSVEIQCVSTAHINQIVQLFHIQSQAKSDWYCVNKYKAHMKSIPELAESIEQLSASDALVLTKMLSQHPSQWQDLLFFAYSCPSGLFKNEAILAALTAGCLKLRCQSIGSLSINDTNVF